MDGKSKNTRPRWKLRVINLAEFDVYEEPVYDRDDFFSILLHYGGKFVYEIDDDSDSNKRVYLNGKSQCFDYWDIHNICETEVLKMMATVGCVGDLVFYYKRYGECLDKGLRELKTQSDFKGLVTHIIETKTTLVEIFVEEKTSHVAADHDHCSGIRMTEPIMYDWDLDTKVNVVMGGHVEPNRSQIPIDPPMNDPNVEPNEIYSNEPNGEFQEHQSPTTENNPRAQDIPESSTVQEEERPPYTVEITNEGVRVETIFEDEELDAPEPTVDQSIPDYTVFPDSGYDLIEEGWPDDVAPNLDPIPEVTTVNEAVDVDPEDVVYGCEERPTQVGERDNVRLGEVHCEEVLESLNPSDELLSNCGSDEDEVQSRDPRIRDFIPEKEMVDPSFHVGQKFATIKEAKAAVDRYQVKNRRKVAYFNLDEHRLNGRCVGHTGCTWRLWISRDGRSNDFLVKTYVPQHNCGTYVKHKKANYHYICELYLETLRINPTMPVPALQNLVRREQQIQITYQVAFRAKQKAMKLIKGDGMEQFRQMFRYVAEVIQSNPGTTFIIQRDDVNCFKRCYVCLGAMKEGIKHCRKIIGMDGCFLKGPYPGQLLSAVGIDANDCIYPFAWALVETETRASWQWFMSRVKCDLGIDDGEEFRWTFISDMQKGLELALKDVFPNSEHRFCVYHIYNRYKINYRGKELKDLLWKSATATNESMFKEAFEALKRRDAGAFNYLLDKGIDHWSRSRFTCEARCDLLLNNICECWNSSIKEARDKPPVTMLETIRCRVMKRIHLRRDEMISKCNERKLCFKIQSKLDKCKDDSRFGHPHWDGGDKYGVECYTTGQHVIDLRKKTCSCRKWQLTGIPCYHAISAIYMDLGNNRSNGQPEEWVDPCYHVDTFLKIYGNLVHPIRDPSQWPTNDAICNPPTIQRGPGRRQTKRSRGAGEAPDPNRISKRGIQISCRKCGAAGHNARNCHNLTIPGQPSASRPRGRPVNPNSARQRSGNAQSAAGRGRSRGNQWRAAWRGTGRVRRSAGATTSTAGPSQPGPSQPVQHSSCLHSGPGPSQPSQ